MRPVLQPGNLVMTTWRARLEEHLGTFQLEGLNLRAGFILAHSLRLAGMNTLTAMAQLLPEREPHSKLYEARILCFPRWMMMPSGRPFWCAGKWACWMSLGFGLDLSRCASTGQSEDLAYVSPRSGRAVSRDAGLPYHERLFHLPAFLRGGEGRYA